MCLVRTDELFGPVTRPTIRSVFVNHDQNSFGLRTCPPVGRPRRENAGTVRPLGRRKIVDVCQSFVVASWPALVVPRRPKVAFPLPFFAIGFGVDNLQHHLHMVQILL